MIEGVTRRRLLTLFGRQRGYKYEPGLQAAVRRRAGVVYAVDIRYNYVAALPGDPTYVKASVGVDAWFDFKRALPGHDPRTGVGDNEWVHQRRWPQDYEPSPRSVDEAVEHMARLASEVEAEIPDVAAAESRLLDFVAGKGRDDPQQDAVNALEQLLVLHRADDTDLTRRLYSRYMQERDPRFFGWPEEFLDALANVFDAPLVLRNREHD